ncbi:hypothetical protein Ndes2526B_g00573 [Nannochloris sp. 'desiccata']
MVSMSDPHYINSLLRNMRLRGEQSISQGNFHPTANPNLKPTEAFQCRVHVNHNYSESFCTTGSQKHVNLEIREYMWTSDKTLATPQAPLKDKSSKPRDQRFSGATNITPLAGIFRDMELKEMNNAAASADAIFRKLCLAQTQTHTRPLATGDEATAKEPSAKRQRKELFPVDGATENSASFMTEQ